LSDELPERVGANGHVYEIIRKPAVGEAGFEPAGARKDPHGSRTFSNVKPDVCVQTVAPNPPKPRQADESRTNPASPRAALMAHLAEDMLAAVGGGDREAARVAYEAIGRLLGPAPGTVTSHDVVDLAAERERRAPR
jgi:hypothetical protein